MLKDIDDIRIEDFILSLQKNVDKDIFNLKKYAEQNGVPIIRDSTKDFLIMILNIKQPKKILEIGTAIGYSSIIMHKTCPHTKIITLEDFPKYIVEAKKNINDFCNNTSEEVVTLIEGNASVYLEENCEKEKFDFIFLDAAKGQYVNWLPYIKKMLSEKGILIADNIFKDGEILEARFLIKKRDRTIHKRMREFLYLISNDESLNTQIFNIGDGISVSLK